MTDLDQRLEALADREARGDWRDVVRRAERRRAAFVRRVVLIAAAILLLAVPALALAVRLAADWLVVEERQELPRARELAVPYVFGDRVTTAARSHRLAQPVQAPLLGEDAALVVSSPDGRALAYHAWKPARGGSVRGGTPLIRLHELASGTDRVLESGAQSLAWRRDDAFAFMRALKPRYENSPQGTLGGQLGHVFVRESLDAPAVRWTRRATVYWVRAWAQSTLLATVYPSYVYSGPQPDRGLHAFAGPGRVWRLPLDDLAALNSDGTLAVGPPATSGDSPPPPYVEIVRIASGRIVARAALPAGLRAIEGLGSWVGERIVVPATPESGVVALVFLRYSHGRLTIEQLIRLDRSTALSAGVRGFRGVDFGRPTFVDSEGRTVVFRANVLGEGDRYVTMFLTCDRIDRRCSRGLTLEPLTRWAALVSNPSRPA